jgi:hypothetical protein
MYVIIDAYDANIKVLGFEVSPKVYQFLFVGILASILVMVWLIIIIVKAREYHRIKVELKNLERRNEIVDYEAEKAKIVKENKNMFYVSYYQLFYLPLPQNLLSLL